MAQKKRSIGVYILLGFLVLGLVGFGGTSLTGTTNTVARVGDREVTVQEYYNRVQGQISAFAQQLGMNVTFAQAQAFGIDQAALASLIQERALDNEVARLGLAAGDNRVRSTILSFQQFQNLDGSFNRERYRDALRQQATNEGVFEETIRIGLARTLVEQAVRGASVPADTYGRVISEWRGETRDIAWVALGPEALTAPVPTPDDAQILAQYEENPALYTHPEQRRITYAWLTPAMILNDVEVDEADVRALYDQRIGEFVMPERRLVERLIYPNEAAATEALARVTAGEAGFEDLVAARGLALSDTDMGDVAIGQLGQAGEGVFAAEAGDVIGPLPTSLGPALFRVNAVLSAQETTFEEVAADLRAELAMQRAERQIQQLSEDFVDQIAGGATIEDLVESTSMQAGEVLWSDEVTEGIAAYEEFRAAAAAATTEDFPELRGLDDGGVFVLRLDGIDPPALNPLDEVRDTVVADWTATATSAAVQARAEELAEVIRTGGFDAAELPVQPVLNPGIRRAEFIEGTPPGFTEAVFALAEGEVAVRPTPTGAIIVEVSSVAEADPEDATVSAEAGMISAEAAQGIDADIAAAFGTALQLSTEVSVDQAVLTSVNAQIP